MADKRSERFGDEIGMLSYRKADGTYIIGSRTAEIRYQVFLDLIERAAAGDPEALRKLRNRRVKRT